MSINPVPVKKSRFGRELSLTLIGTITPGPRIIRGSFRAVKGSQVQKVTVFAV
jgi:hypothetical protein